MFYNFICGFMFCMLMFNCVNYVCFTFMYFYYTNTLLCCSPLHFSRIQPDVPTALWPIGHAAPYRATGPLPTPSNPINQSTHNLQPANSYNCTQFTPKAASVVLPEDGRLTPETCRGLRHGGVLVKVKVYWVGYIIVIHNDTRSTKYKILGVLLTGFSRVSYGWFIAICCRFNVLTS
jgi:hypothetical protein